jgi:hypothetical protein
VSFEKWVSVHADKSIIITRCKQFLILAHCDRIDVRTVSS